MTTERPKSDAVLMDLVRIQPVAGPEACSVTKISGYDDDFLLLDPEPLAGEFPADAFFELDDKVMRSMGVKSPEVVGDLIKNRHSALLCSPALAAELAPVIGPHELLEVAIRDGKKKAATYVIVRPLDRVDVIDQEASGRTPDPDDEDLIDGRISDLVIDASRVPEDRQLFVPEHRSGEYLARRAFAESLQARFSGILLRELDDPIS